MITLLAQAGTGDPTWLNNPAITNELLPATLETGLMTLLAMIITVIFGLPLGLILSVTAPGGLAAQPVVYRVLSFIVDVGRSIPFIILMIALIPFTRFMVGSALGWQATAVPLAVGAIPFFARLVENALREVDSGKVEAVQMMGATKGQIMRGVLLRESWPGIIGGLTVTIVAVISYTAMAGAVGGGGLGALAISYGYNRYQSDVMLACIVLLVALVWLCQLIGDQWARTLANPRAATGRPAEPSAPVPPAGPQATVPSTTTTP